MAEKCCHSTWGLNRKGISTVKNYARAVVIGGGVVGVSTLYHLAKSGWTDSCLLERKDLASGSTWHAAGLLPLFNMSYSVGQIHKYSIQLYKQLQNETGQDVGFRNVTNIRLATTKDRIDEYQHYAGVAKTIGVDVNFLTPEEIIDIWPLARIEGLIGAIQHSHDGYIQPSELTQALARGARIYGGTIHRNTSVLEINKKPNGEWQVITNQGEMICEHLISATGNFAQKTAKLLSINIPVIPVEHQFIVTEPHPAIIERHEKGSPELAVLRESDGSWYMREENGGLLLGPYEKDAPACYVNGPDDESEYELFQEDLDRLEPHIESAIKRVPAFGEVGIKRVFNGAIAYTPDGSPLVGPASNMKNLWLNEGHSFGITAAGGAGYHLAEWITEGESSIDMLGVDPRRFGPYAKNKFLIKKNEEAYANVFTVHYPDEERIAARPLKTAPCYDRMLKKGAVFGQSFGWERPNWFAPNGVKREDHWSFRRSKWFNFVADEVSHVASNVGILDMTPFAKMRVSGLHAAKFLNKIFASKIPKENGNICLAYGLSQGGGVHSEFTVTKESENRFYLVSAGGYKGIDHDWIKKQLPLDYSVRIDDLTTQLGVFVVAGPRSRELLQSLSSADFSDEAFPWMTSKDLSIGLAYAKVLRINFVGELGYELHHPIEIQNCLLDTLFEPVSNIDVKPFGIRAMNSMRIEKSYKMPGAELSVEYCALESGLTRFIDLTKTDSIGIKNLINWKEKGLKNKFVTLEVKDIQDMDPFGNNPLLYDNKLIGRSTSGSFGFRVNKSLALAMVKPDFALVGTRLQIEILGYRYSCNVIGDSPYDPKNLRIISA